jgi:2-polyprenyl-6-methoxyphenol hydroxylase-like FAD-dependent oxidoreductase
MLEHDILVRGCGAVGLAAALALSRQGLRVVLQGPSAPGAPLAQEPDVRAYALNAVSVQLLVDLKVWAALPADARTAVHEMRIQGDQRGGLTGGALEFSAWSQGVPELAWIVDAAALEDALQRAAGFAPHLTLLSPTQTPPPVALQVLAEGKASASREAWGVAWTRHAYGHQGIAARLLGERPHDGVARQWFRSPDVLALLPLDRPQAGRGYGLVWSVPQAQAQQLMALDDAGFEAALMDATGGAVGPLTLASKRSQWPLALAQADAVHGAGWVLVGDAAHVVHPLAGQGLNLGLADVAALAQVLAERESWRPLGDARLLARYARQRWAPTRAMAGVTDGLLHLFAAPGPAPRWLRNTGLGLVDRAGPLKRLLVGRALGA